MTVAAISTEEQVVTWADVVGSLFVVVFIVVNALDKLSTGLFDLLDRSAGRSVREAIDRTLAGHVKDYGELARVRSRRSGRVVFIEIALRFDPALSIGQVNQRVDALKQALSREIEHADISIMALAATDWDQNKRLRSVCSASPFPTCLHRSKQLHYSDRHMKSRAIERSHSR